VTVCADSLDPNGMVVDFAAISAIVKRHDHRDLNETMGGIPATAENLAYLIASEVNGEMPARESGGPCAHVERVAVSENDTNLAVWSRD
jgi:6-pyruvoyl-tetrahydropterin synthase